MATPFSEKLWNEFRTALGLIESPLGVYYTNDPPDGKTPKAGMDPGAHLCMIGLLKRARHHGETVYFDREHFGCPGGAYYMGFFESPRPEIEYFLSCGIPGQMEGERYIKTPELARAYFLKMKPRPAPASYCVFKPIEKFREGERPEVVVFFGPPDILSGLFVLTNYALELTDGVYAPFGSGCGTILTYPLKEAEKEEPRAGPGDVRRLGKADGGKGYPHPVHALLSIPETSRKCLRKFSRNRKLEKGLPEDWEIRISGFFQKVNVL